MFIGFPDKGLQRLHRIDCGIKLLQRMFGMLLNEVHEQLKEGVA